MDASKNVKHFTAMFLSYILIFHSPHSILAIHLSTSNKRYFCARVRVASSAAAYADLGVSEGIFTSKSNNRGYVIMILLLFNNYRGTQIVWPRFLCLYFLSFVALCGGARSRRALFIGIRDDDGSREESAVAAYAAAKEVVGGRLWRKKIVINSCIIRPFVLSRLITSHCYKYMYIIYSYIVAAWLFLASSVTKVILILHTCNLWTVMMYIDT